MKYLPLAVLLSVSLSAAQSIPPAPPGLTNAYDLAEAAGRTFGLPPYLMSALVRVESAGNPRALSSAGAMGLAQLMPATARSLGVTQPFDPWQSVYGGAKYLRTQLNTFNNRLDLALAAYNAGPGNVIAYGNKVPPFKETQNYVQKISTLYSVYIGTPNIYAPTASNFTPTSPFTPPPLPPIVQPAPLASLPPRSTQPPSTPAPNPALPRPATTAPAATPASPVAAAPTQPQSSAGMLLHTTPLNASPSNTTFALITTPASLGTRP